MHKASQASVQWSRFDWLVERLHADGLPPWSTKLLRHQSKGGRFWLISWQSTCRRFASLKHIAFQASVQWGRFDWLVDSLHADGLPPWSTKLLRHQSNGVGLIDWLTLCRPTVCLPEAPRFLDICPLVVDLIDWAPSFSGILLLGLILEACELFNGLPCDLDDELQFCTGMWKNTSLRYCPPLGEVLRLNFFFLCTARS